MACRCRRSLVRLGVALAALAAIAGAASAQAGADPPPTAWQPVISDTTGAIGHLYTVTQPSTVSGVLALLPTTDIPETGSGELAWNAEADTLSWRGGPAVAVNPTISASYELPEPSGGPDLIAVVTAGELPVSDASDTLTVSQTAGTAGFGDLAADSVRGSAVYDGDVYVGLYYRDAGTGLVLRSADGINWVAAGPDNFGQESCHASAMLGICHIDSFGVFDGELYAGTDSGQIWRTSDGTLWTEASPSLPAGQNITDIQTYNGTLYASQASNVFPGGAIFASTNGTNWTEEFQFPFPDQYTEFLEPFGTQLFADAGSFGGVFGAGPGEISSSSNGLAWSQSGTSGFGDSNNTDISGMAVLNGALYVGTFNPTEGAQVYRTTDGTTWTEVASDGFGDPDNQMIHQMVVFDDELYAGTFNPVHGGEIWRSSDGTDWTLANTPGFGTGKQETIRSFFTLGGYLYANAENDCTPPSVNFPGCQEGGWELWRLEANPPSCQVIATTVAVPGRYSAGDYMQVSAQAPGGFQAISDVQINNGAVFWSTPTPGTTDPVVLTAVRGGSGSSTSWSFDVTDEAGQTTHCA